jgi:hypothetical protein
MTEKNILGGANSKSLYVPMSEIEQELLNRLAESKDFRVHIVDWGVVNNPRVIVGDLRIAFHFQLQFDRPEVPIPLWYLDMELRTGSGLLLFKERQPTTYGGRPVQVSSGVYFDLVWDIAIKAIDPKTVKALMPQVTGLTSRRLDKDSGDITFTGNMRLNTAQMNALRLIQHGEQVVKRLDQARLRNKN